MNNQFKIRGDYQNHSGKGFGAALWDIYHIYNQINTAWLGIRYDIRHATVEGGLSWPRTFRLIQPYIKSLDMKDFKWEINPENGKYAVENVPLGEGMVDFEEYSLLLKEFPLKINYTLHMEYELGGAEDGRSELKISREEFLQAADKDLKYVRKLGKKKT
jgi:sugar phosphate isomerase/epimerase